MQLSNRSRVVAITPNTYIDTTMDIQLIEKQNNIYRLKINGVNCCFISLDLFINGLFPIKRCYVNGSLGWYVNRKFVSYNQIKKCINFSKWQRR
jgi:hypothetical protein